MALFFSLDHPTAGGILLSTNLNLHLAVRMSDFCHYYRFSAQRRFKSYFQAKKYQDSKVNIIRYLLSPNLNLFVFFRALVSPHHKIKR